MNKHYDKRIHFVKLAYQAGCENVSVANSWYSNTKAAKTTNNESLLCMFKQWLGIDESGVKE